MPEPTTPAPLPDPTAALQDAVRLAALDATDLRGPERAAALDPLVRVAARALRVPVAQINVLTAEAQVPVAAYAEPEAAPGRWMVPAGLDASYCQHVVAAGRTLLIEDAREHPVLCESRATREGGIVAYAGAPLLAPPALGDVLAGRVLGTVCAVDFVPRRWSADDVALLEDLAAAVTAELEVRAAAATRAARDVAERAVAALGRADAALAESEARFRTMADHIPQLAWMADESGALFWYNQRWFEYTGTTLEAMRGWGWQAVHHPDHVARVTEKFRASIAAGEPWEDTFPLRGTDGEYRWFLSRALPVRDADGGAARWFGTNTDVTERIEAERERERLLAAEQEARRVAEAANAAKSEFLAVMSHELRTPLNAIGGYAELLDLGLRGPVTDAQRTDLARIRHSQQHLLGLINEILNFTRLQRGAVEFDVVELPVAGVLQDVSSMVLPQAAQKGLSYRVDGCAAELAARADAEKLRQALVNLLTNAVKFTAAPGAVRLSCEPTEHDGAPAVAFIVEDTGIGIPADKLEQVFEPFVQVRADLKRTAEGTGLGLAISRDLARAMGGDLTATSEVGVGSTFRLIVPRAPDHEDDAVAATPSSAVLGAPAEATAEVRRLLAAEGVHAVLRFLNARTSHRYTGLYRFDGAVLRNVALFDREQPATRRGADAPRQETYCDIVGATERPFALTDAGQDPRVAAHAARESVVSYCGALVRGARGEVLGTLCSFDVEPRPVPTWEIPLLEAVAPLLAPVVEGDGA